MGIYRRFLCSVTCYNRKFRCVEQSEVHSSPNHTATSNNNTLVYSLIATSSVIYHPRPASVRYVRTYFAVFLLLSLFLSVSISLLVYLSLFFSAHWLAYFFFFCQSCTQTWISYSVKPPLLFFRKYTNLAACVTLLV